MLGNSHSDAGMVDLINRCKPVAGASHVTAINFHKRCAEAKAFDARNVTHGEGDVPFVFANALVIAHHILVRHQVQWYAEFGSQRVCDVDQYAVDLSLLVAPYKNGIGNDHGRPQLALRREALSYVRLCMQWTCGKNRYRECQKSAKQTNRLAFNHFPSSCR